MLGKTLESPLDNKIKPVNPKRNQPWIFIGRTDAEAGASILWPPDTKGWLIWKDLDAGKDWREEEKGTTEDEMIGWHHWLNGHGFEWTLVVDDGRAAVHGVTNSQTRLSNWTEQWCSNCSLFYPLEWKSLCFYCHQCCKANCNSCDLFFIVQ